jgi:hypothetical protein
MVAFEIVEEVGAGLMRIRYQEDNKDQREQIWIRAMRRGVIGRCMFCGKSLVGQPSWRPSGSPPNRSWRICLEDMVVGRKEVIKEIPIA